MAIRDVILGYAKGQKGDKGEKGDPGVQGQVGPQGEPGNIADAEITDTHGVSATAGQRTTAQRMFDAIGNRILNVLVSNEALTERLAGYVAKSIMSNVQVNSTNNVPTSALVYAMQQAIEQTNDDLSKTTFAAGGDHLDINFRIGDKLYSLQFINTVSTRDYAAILYNSSWEAIWTMLPANKCASKSDLQKMNPIKNYVEGGNVATTIRGLISNGQRYGIILFNNNAVGLPSGYSAGVVQYISPNGTSIIYLDFMLSENIFHGYIHDGATSPVWRKYVLEAAN